MKSVLSRSTMAAAVGVFAGFAAFAATDASAQAWTSAYESSTATGNCAALPEELDAGFVSTPIVSQALFGDIDPIRVLKMAFWKQPEAQFTDIYMVEKGTGGTGGTNGTARVLYYNAATEALSVIGTLTNLNHGGGSPSVDEQGLLGIALNPVTFGEDNFIYLLFNVGFVAGNDNPVAPGIGWRVSRFTLDPETKMMDMESEKVILNIPAVNSGRWHTGGAMQFDNFGNLYISTGDNESLAMGPGNTADLRGSVLRIKPDDSERGYSIPANNFGAYWAQVWEDSGLVSRAAEYRDTSKVKPEIYVKGTRNAYTISVDKSRLGWLQWSECGPDAQRAEEHSLTTTPAFSGWPFWAGNGVRQSGKAGSYDEPNEPGSGAEWTAFNFEAMSTEVPVNNWEANPGVDTLPPMHVPSHTYTSPSCAAGGGPIIRYNGAVNNPNQMPPHLDNVAMYSDFMGSTLWAKKIDPETGMTTGEATEVFTMSKSGRPNLNNPVDFQQGPDGALYMIDWGTGCCSSGSNANNNGIVRITYTGTCADPELGPVSVLSERPVSRIDAAGWLKVGANTFTIVAPGPHEATVLDMAGRTLHTFRGEGHKQYQVPALGSGVHVLRVKTSQGMVSRPLAAGL